MSNDYYSGVSTSIIARTLARAAGVNAQLAAIGVGFGKLPSAQRLNEGRVTYAMSGGTADVLTATLDKAPSAYRAGLTLNLLASYTNTGSATINVNGLGPKTIKRANGLPLEIGDILAGANIDLRYDGSAFRLVSGLSGIGSLDAESAALLADAMSNLGAGGLSERLDSMDMANPIMVHLLRDVDATDDQDAFAAAVTLSKATRRPILFVPTEGSGPDGEYLISEAGQNNDPTRAGNLCSNLVIIIPPGAEITKAIASNPFIFYYNPIGIGTWDAPSVVDADTLPGDEDDPDEFAAHDIYIYGGGRLYDDITLGYSENQSLIHVSGVNRCYIDGLLMDGFRSDAVYVGSGDVGPETEASVAYATQVRHNKQVWISNCVMDGINKNNRNAISWIDCDGGGTYNIEINNCTRPGGVGAHDPMNINTGFRNPGAMDVEPNGFTFSRVVIRNLAFTLTRVNNCGGHAIAVLLLRNSEEFGVQTNIVIDRLFVNGAFSALGVGGEPDGGSFQIKAKNIDARECDSAFVIGEGRGVEIEDFYFEDCDTAGIIGYADALVAEVYLRRGKFVLCGNTIGAFTMTHVDEWSLEDATFIDCPPYPFTMTGAGSIANGKITGCKAIINAGAAKEMGTRPAVLTYAGTPDINNGSITESGNDWNALAFAASTLAVNGSQVAAAPTTGIYQRDNVLYGHNVAPGEVAEYHVRHTNTVSPPYEFAEVLKPGAEPDVEYEPTYTLATLPSGITHDAGRFTVIETGLHVAYSTDTVATTGSGLDLIVYAPRSDKDEFYVGVTDDATPAALADCKYLLWFNQGELRSKIDGSSYSLHGTYEYGQKIRLRITPSGLTFHGTDPATGVEAERVNPIATSPPAAVRLVVVANGAKGASAQVAGFEAVA